MTLATTPGIRCLEPIAAVVIVVIAAISVRPVIVSHFFLLFRFGVRYYWDLALSVPALLGLSPIF
jgi:hypothetical protein